MVYVTVHQGESLDSAMKRFNQKVQHSGLLRDLKDHAHYEKPSEQRRRQRRRRSSTRG
jgi:small subunit ribosomal protein S21